MYKWYLPTLSEVISLKEQPQAVRSHSLAQQRVKAEREWCGAIAALNALLQEMIQSDSSDSLASKAVPQGVVLSGALPVVHLPELTDRFATWTFTAEFVKATGWMPHLLPAPDTKSSSNLLTTSVLPLLPNDPLAAEQFCLALTSEFSLVMVLGENQHGEPAFLFSFDPEVVWQAWRSLQSRLLMTTPPGLKPLDQLVKQFAPTTPLYQTVMQFSRLMLDHLPDPLEWEPRRETATSQNRHVITIAAQPEASDKQALGDPLSANSIVQPADVMQVEQWMKDASKQADRSLEELSQSKHCPDIELLQAIAHEIRTPLTTIRTLTRLLLKRKDLSPDVIKRLQIIDQECTEQIDRFTLIFRAVELETSANKSPLSSMAAIPLAQVFQQSLPRWQQQASQRNLTLEVILPQKLPMVVTDPTMLDQVLTGLIDRITHSLPPNSHIQIRVELAGHQLKLQFQSHPQVEFSGSDSSAKPKTSWFPPNLKSVGQLLMFQPETGSLSLNLSVTKNLFQALGGKLVVRHRPEQGEVLTVFLPMETRAKDEEG